MASWCLDFFLLLGCYQRVNSLQGAQLQCATALSRRWTTVQSNWSRTQQISLLAHSCDVRTGAVPNTAKILPKHVLRHVLRYLRITAMATCLVKYYPPYGLRAWKYICCSLGLLALWLPPSDTCSIRKFSSSSRFRDGFNFRDVQRSGSYCLLVAPKIIWGSPRIHPPGRWHANKFVALDSRYILVVYCVRFIELNYGEILRQVGKIMRYVEHCRGASYSSSGQLDRWLTARHKCSVMSALVSW